MRTHSPLAVPSVPSQITDAVSGAVRAKFAPSVQRAVVVAARTLACEASVPWKAQALAVHACTVLAAIVSTHSGLTRLAMPSGLAETPAAGWTAGAMPSAAARTQWAAASLAAPSCLACALACGVVAPPAPVSLATVHRTRAAAAVIDGGGHI